MNFKTTKLILTGLLFIFALVSCDKNEVEIANKSTDTYSASTDENINFLTNILSLECNNHQLIKEVHDNVTKSMEYGLEESMYTDVILNDSTKAVRSEILNRSNDIKKSKQYKSKSNIFSIRGLEIYWPYSEDWDGKSTPVIVKYPSDEKSLNDEYYTAYRYTQKKNGEQTIDSLLVNEEYSKKHPVWIVKTSNISDIDLYHIFNGENTTNGIHYIPRKSKKKQTQNASYVSNIDNVAETRINSIQSTVQHDTWINGGSEYILYWFFPTNSFGLAEHHTEQIQLSRKEISKGATRNLDFIANYDWFIGQSHNRLKVIEFDPGENTDIDIKIKASYKPKDSDITVDGEFSTKITINNNDDMIMEHTMTRTSMLTTETRVNDKYFQRKFSGNGVNVVASIKSIEGVSL